MTNVVKWADRLVSAAEYVPRFGLRDLIAILNSKQQSNEMKLELLTAMIEMEFKFDSAQLIITLKRMCQSDDKDISFFSATALAVGNPESAKSFCEHIEKEMSLGSFQGSGEVVLDAIRRQMCQTD